MERILIVNFPGEMGGTEKFVQNLFESIDKEKYILDIIYYHGIHSYYKEYFEKNGSILYEMPYYVKKPFEFITQLTNFYKQHKEYRIIYCHANHASTMLYTFPIWFDRGRIILFHSHNSSSTHLILHKVLSHIVVKRSNYLFTCSDIAAKFMYGKKCSNYKLINNGINLKEFKLNPDMRFSIRKKYGINDEFVVGHVGGFRDQKNHLFLIDIFAEIQKQSENSKLILVGDGELRTQIEERIAAYNLNDNVILVGNVDNAKDYYQMFDVFVLPSLFEGLPFVGIEAQASGTISIFSDVIESKVAVTPLASFCSLEATPKEWADKILSYKNYGKKDYTDMIENAGYGLQTIKKQYQLLFDQIINSK